MTKQERFDRAYLRDAFMHAMSLSKDPSTKVGAMILGVDGRSTAFGYNGFPAGAPESPEVWNNRPEKYRRVQHSELNALLNCPFPTQGATIYCTLHPCHNCMGAIINAGIKTVVYYGAPWEREENRDIVEEWRPLLEWRHYDYDPVIELLRIQLGASEHRIETIPVGTGASE